MARHPALLSLASIRPYECGDGFLCADRSLRVQSATAEFEVVLGGVGTCGADRGEPSLSARTLSFGRGGGCAPWMAPGFARGSLASAKTAFSDRAESGA